MGRSRHPPLGPRLLPAMPSRLLLGLGALLHHREVDEPAVSIGEHGRGGPVAVRAAAASDGADANMDRVGPVIERERSRQIARIGNNLNQLACWANTDAAAVEVVEVIAKLVSFERSVRAVARFDGDGGDVH